jgi:chromosome segregation ATPase
VKQSPHKRNLSEYKSDIDQLDEEIKSLNEEEEQLELEMMDTLEKLSTRAEELAGLLNGRTHSLQQLSQRIAAKKDKLEKMKKELEIPTPEARSIRDDCY